MSDTVILAIIVATAPTLASIAGLIVSISNSRKADVITGHVNSAAAASAQKIEGLEKEINLLRSVISEKTQTAAVLAQASSPAKAIAPEATP